MEELLLTWSRRNGRDLPWRRRRDPYAVLVSEVMLQQTQVGRVVPRFEAWMERWPTVESLAGAGLDDVIRAWQGLGYNRRAVSLHRAARIVAENGWPADLTELPGVGGYTAAAVRRFAWDEPVLPMDTNVMRVIERSGGEFGPAAAEALMDLGREVCLARVPRCGACPLRRMPVARPELRAASQAVALRRLVPPAPRRDLAPRGRRSLARPGSRGRRFAHPRRARRRGRRVSRAAAVARQPERRGLRRGR